MRRLSLLPLLALSLTAPPAHAGNNDPMITIGGGDVNVGGDMSRFLAPSVGLLGELFNKLQTLGNFEPSREGATGGTAFERSAEILKAKLGAGFSVTLEGVGNLQYLGARYYYNEVQGGIGVQYDFLPENAVGQFSVRISPLHGEVAWIRTGMYATPDPDQPLAAAFGNSYAVDAWHRLGGGRAGIEAQFRPLEEVTGTHDGGWAAYSALYFRAPLDKLIPAMRGERGLWLTARMSYHDRGTAFDSIQHWPNLEGAEIRRSWQAMVMVEWKPDAVNLLKKRQHEP